MDFEDALCRLEEQQAQDPLDAEVMSCLQEHLDGCQGYLNDILGVCFYRNIVEG